jgi:hypothetical protein
VDEIEPIEPWIPGKTDSAKMLWLSDSFAEAASVLCEAMVEDTYERQYTNTRVILHLCIHALELYFKGAIAAKTRKHPPKTHRLDVLHSQYRDCYPSERHAVDAPFPDQVFEDALLGLFPGSLEDYQRSHDQRYRYPTDAIGQPFEEREPFDPLTHRDAIANFRSQINLMVFRIDRDYWA